MQKLRNFSGAPCRSMMFDDLENIREVGEDDSRGDLDQSVKYSIYEEEDQEEVTFVSKLNPISRAKTELDALRKTKRVQKNISIYNTKSQEQDQENVINGSDTKSRKQSLLKGKNWLMDRDAESKYSSIDEKQDSVRIRSPVRKEYTKPMVLHPVDIHADEKESKNNRLAHNNRDIDNSSKNTRHIDVQTSPKPVFDTSCDAKDSKPVFSDNRHVDTQTSPNPVLDEKSSKSISNSMSTNTNGWTSQRMDAVAEAKSPNEDVQRQASKSINNSISTNERIPQRVDAVAEAKTPQEDLGERQAKKTYAVVSPATPIPHNVARKKQVRQVSAKTASPSSPFPSSSSRSPFMPKRSTPLSQSMKRAQKHILNSMEGIDGDVVREFVLSDEKKAKSKSAAGGGGGDEKDSGYKPEKDYTTKPSFTDKNGDFRDMNQENTKPQDTNMNTKPTKNYSSKPMKMQALKPEKDYSTKPIQVRDLTSSSGSHRRTPKKSSSMKEGFKSPKPLPAGEGARAGAGARKFTSPEGRKESEFDPNKTIDDESIELEMFDFDDENSSVSSYEEQQQKEYELCQDEGMRKKSEQSMSKTRRKEIRERDEKLEKEEEEEKEEVYDYDYLEDSDKPKRTQNGFNIENDDKSCVEDLDHESLGHDAYLQGKAHSDRSQYADDKESYTNSSPDAYNQPYTNDPIYSEDQKYQGNELYGDDDDDENNNTYSEHSTYPEEYNNYADDQTYEDADDQTYVIDDNTVQSFHNDMDDNHQPKSTDSTYQSEYMDAPSSSSSSSSSSDGMYSYVQDELYKSPSKYRGKRHGQQDEKEHYNHHRNHHRNRSTSSPNEDDAGMESVDEDEGEDEGEQPSGVEYLFSKVRHNHIEEVQRMLRKGTFNVNAMDERGNTILHITAQNNLRKMAGMIVGEYNGAVNVENLKGLTALDYSDKYGFRKMSALLISYGAERS